MLCNKCGQEVSEGAKFCNNCGNPMDVDAAQNTSQNNYQDPYQNNYPNPSFPNQNQYQNQYQNTYNDPYVAPNPNAKSKTTAGILGILLGAFGIHNFYLGYTGKAIAQLLITVLSCGILAAVSSIWGLVEGIQILTGSINVDGSGMPLKD